MNYETRIVKLDDNTVATKNSLLKEMLESDKDYFFLVEDNCKIKDPKVYKIFIEASEATGIEALMWGNGGLNKRLPFEDDPSIEYFSDFATAFTMYTRNAIEKAGLLDEKMPPNTWQELEHAKRIGDMGFSTPFGMFASPKGVDELLSLTKQKDEFRNLKQMEEALKYWEAKDIGTFPVVLENQPQQQTGPIEMI